MIYKSLKMILKIIISLKFKNTTSFHDGQSPFKMLYQTFSKVIFNKDLFNVIQSYIPGRKYKDWTNGDTAVKNGHLFLIKTKKDLEYTDYASILCIRSFTFEKVIDKTFYQKQTEIFLELCAKKIISRRCLENIIFNTTVDYPEEVIDKVLSFRQPIDVYLLNILVIHKKYIIIKKLIKSEYYSKEIFFPSFALKDLIENKQIEILEWLLETKFQHRLTNPKHIEILRENIERMKRE